jgi:hypothetical protein
MLTPTSRTPAVLGGLLAASFLCAEPLGAQVPWRHLSSTTGALPAPTGATQQTTCLTADFNRDGSDDVLVASRNYGGRVQAWLSQPGGTWLRIDVDPSNVQTEAGGAIHDIDGDGDPDVVIGQDFAGSDIYWWENPYPSFGSPWTRRTIKSGGGTKHHDQIFGDFDGDGATELVAWNQNANQLLLFEIPSDPRGTTLPWPSRVIFNAPSDLYEGLAAGDVDLDGVVDIVGAGRWWKHVGGGSYQVQVIDAAMFFTRAAIGQLVPGGRPEIVFVPGDASGNGNWYEWNGSSWVAHSLGYVYHGHSLDIADVDGDGAQDVFLGEMRLGSASCRVRVLYGDGTGSFREQVLATGNDIHEGRLADLDGDGDLDIAHKPYNDGTPRLEMWINDRAALPLDRWQRHLVDGALPYRPVFVGAGDFDADGHLDLAAGNWWWKNPGSLGGTWQRREIHVGGYLNFATTFDIDGDGDLDLLGTRAPGDQANADFAWAENRGALGLQVHTGVIPRAQGNFLQGVRMQRFAGPTGAREVALSWHDASVGVQMLGVPASPASSTWSWRRIQTLSQGEDLSSGDLDGDGDLDLVLGTLWLENPSWTPRTMGIVSDLQGVGGTPEPDRNRCVDLDGDGDLDVVVGLENGREVVWFENPRPSGSATSTWTRRVLATIDGQGFSLDTADFDRDGDLDVVVGEHRGSAANRVVLLVNDGTRQSWPQVIVDSQPSNVIDHHNGTIAVDLDGDGDLDLASIGWTNPKLWLFENRAITGGGGQPQQAAPPVIEGEGRVFSVARKVAITPADPAHELRYTLDGSEPTATSARYTAPITLRGTTRLRARAFQTGWLPSEVATADFARLPEPLTLWRFDEGAGTLAFDAGRGGHHGLLQGTLWVPGFQNGALEFSRTGTRVRGGTFDVVGSGLTLSGWVRGNDFSYLTNGDARILSKSTSTAEQDHVWMLSTIAVGSDIRPRLRVRVNGLTRTLIASSGHIAPGQWAHVAGTFDGSELAIYLNGNEVGRLAAPGTLSGDPSVEVWVGDNPPQGARPFDGVIDEVRIDDRALALEQIGALARSRPLSGVLAYGSTSPSCQRDPHLEALRSAQAPDAHFGFAGRGSEALASGLLLISGAPQIPALGIDRAALWIDPQQVFAHLSLAADAAGEVVLATPLPWVPTGTVFFAQALWVNPATCASTRGAISASAGLGVLVR